MARTPPEGQGLGIHRILVDVTEQVGTWPGGPGGLAPCLYVSQAGAPIQLPALAELTEGLLGR